VTAVSLDNSLGNRQSQPGTASLGFARLPETVEQVRQILSCDSGAGIGDAKQHAAIARFGRDRDATSASGELERVADQVLEDLQQAVAIGPELG
jgi:hypothetical protein